MSNADTPRHEIGGIYSDGADLVLVVDIRDRTFGFFVDHWRYDSFEGTIKRCETVESALGGLELVGRELEPESLDESQARGLLRAVHARLEVAQP